MSDTTLIAVGIGAVAAMSVILGHVLGEQRRHREVEAAMTRQLASYEALLHALAEDYDPPDEPDEHRRKLPPGWAVIEGGGMGALVAIVVAWLRRLRPGIVGATAAAGAVAAIVAVALLGNGAAPAGPHAVGQPPSPMRTAGTAYVKPGTPPYTQTPLPPHRSGTPALPVAPARTPRASSPPPTSASAPPQPTPTRSTTPRPSSPSRSPAPPTRAPSPPPTAGCPVDLTLVLVGIGVYVCV